MAEPATLTDKLPILVSAPVGYVVSQLLNAIQQVCHCFKDADQLAGWNTLLGFAVGGAMALWQYRNVWSKASVAKVLDANSPHLSTAQATAIAQGDAAPGVKL